MNTPDGDRVTSFLQHCRCHGFFKPGCNIGGNLSARDIAILHSLAPGLLAPPRPPAEEPSWRPGQPLPRGYI